MLIGKFVTLRVIEKSDAEMIRVWKNSPENYNYFANRNFISDIKQENWISSKLVDNSGLYFIIIDNKTGIPIGMTLLEDIDHRNRNACWGIYIADLKYRKRIYALEATYLLLNYAFDYLNLYKIYGNTLSCNPKGRNFHQFMGFTEEAVFNNHVFVNGSYSDLLWIRMFSEEWNKKKEELSKLIANSMIKREDESKNDKKARD